MVFCPLANAGFSSLLGNIGTPKHILTTQLQQQQPILGSWPLKLKCATLLLEAEAGFTTLSLHSLPTA